MKPRVVFVCVLAVLLAGCAAAPVARAADSANSRGPARPPNIVFIMADDLGWGDVGALGQTKIRTPHIDALAAAGTAFTQYYAGAAVCAPTRCALMTGLHTGHGRVRGNHGADGGRVP